MFVHKLVICFYMPHHCRGKHDYFTVTAHQISYACSQLPRMESRIQQTHSISFKINTLFTGMMRLLVIESNFSVMESVYRNLCISFCYFCIFFFFSVAEFEKLILSSHLSLFPHDIISNTWFCLRLSVCTNVYASIRHVVWANVRSHAPEKLT